MKLASLAFFIALALAVALTVAGIMGFDTQSIGLMVGKVDDDAMNAQEAQDTADTKQAQDGKALNPVPVGTFKGPTGKPTVVGPSGPPPNE